MKNFWAIILTHDKDLEMSHHQNLRKQMSYLLKEIRNEKVSMRATRVNAPRD